MIDAWKALNLISSKLKKVEFFLKQVIINWYEPVTSNVGHIVTFYQLILLL